MKRTFIDKVLWFFAIIMLISTLLLFKSCEADDCMMCKIVTYENGVKVSESDPVQYCGAALDEILNEGDIPFDNRTTRWECK